mmetsp:Transcript_24873/g.37574  ORF Transcript_24873/g.37574 Transcript_24873/m.37574 type:complete len:680 (+) Transcript_24873:117-2156(+)
MTFFLNVELSNSTKALGKTEEKLEKLSSKEDGLVSTTPLERLKCLESTILDLDLTRDISLWNEKFDANNATINHDARRCIELARTLCRHQKCNLTTHIFEKEYQPLYSYVRATLLVTVRQSFRKIKFPSKEATTYLLNDISNFSENRTEVTACCVWLIRLQIENNKAEAHVMGNQQPSEKFVSVIEICRPIIERVSFHFVQESQDRLSSTRIDRLPEWLLKYVRDNIFEGGPLNFVENVASIVGLELVIFQFLNEMYNLVNFILITRGFFRHEKIAGPRSNPDLLSNAVEQLFSFDSYIRDLINLEVYPKSLAQYHLVEDEDLWTWFLERQREWAVSTLFETQVSPDTAPNRVSPRAELFSALIRSIQCKATLLDTPSSYIDNVARPLHEEFADAIDETEKDLLRLMSQSNVLVETNLEENLECWIDLINGAHMAAIRLQGGMESYIDNDLADMSASMGRRRDQLLDRCAHKMVESVIKEKSKFLSYLMRCPYTLSLDEIDVDESISEDLLETTRVFSIVTSTCSERNLKNSGGLNDIISFAPMALRRNIIERITYELLNIALNQDGMTPDINHAGAQVFCRDTRALFGTDMTREEESNLPPSAMRLFDVINFMSCSHKLFREIKMAICGLVHHREPLRMHSFTEDGTLQDEAYLMIRAKGYSWMCLEDVVSVLNRRKE